MRAHQNEALIREIEELNEMIKNFKDRIDHLRESNTPQNHQNDHASSSSSPQPMQTARKSTTPRQAVRLTPRNVNTAQPQVHTGDSKTKQEPQVGLLLCD